MSVLDQTQAATTFGQRFGFTPTQRDDAPRNRKDLPEAQYWLNVGVVAEGANDDGTDRFIALPMGLALDTMTPLEIKGRPSDYNDFQQARNQLLEDIVGLAKTLEPGAEHIIQVGDGLAIQIRRINAKEQVSTAPEENRYVRRLNFQAA